jgi:hypothetical protein
MLLLSQIKSQLKIKNIQRGSVIFVTGSNFANVSITTVNTSKTELRNLGDSVAFGASNTGAYVSLLDATTVQCYRISTSAAAAQRVAWELTEWE